MSVEAAAIYLGISERSVRRHSSPDCRGKSRLTSSRVGGLIKFLRSDLDAFVLRSSTVKTSTRRTS
jgi:hypothetical protein